MDINNENREIVNSNDLNDWEKEKEELKRIINEQQNLIEKQKKEIQILEERIELLANIDGKKRK